MIKKISIAVSTIVFLTSCSAEDPNAEANKIFVEKQQKIEAAESDKYNKKIKIYNDALKTLKIIRDNYPSSNLAVQIASGTNDGVLNKQGLQLLKSKAAAIEIQSLTSIFENQISKLNGKSDKDSKRKIRDTLLNYFEKIDTPCADYKYLSEMEIMHKEVIDVHFLFNDDKGIGILTFCEKIIVWGSQMKKELEMVKP